MTQSAPSKPRLAYLDMTKGILVILMVVYHGLNYTSQYHLAFRYLSFLPASFILITGFLISSVYSARYKAGDRQVVPRLIFRGVRLLLLFTALNIVAQFVRSPAYGMSVGIEAFFRSWEDVYVVGGSRIAAFEVLLPIAYLLLMAPLLIAVMHRHPAVLPIASAVLLVSCILIERKFVALPNVNLLCAGITGMLAGRLLPNPAMLGRFHWLTLLVYIVYFPLGVSQGNFFVVQLLGAFVVLALLCAHSAKVLGGGWWRHRLIRIGQYSLLSYIAQIGILQLLSRVVGRPDPVSIEAALLFAGTLVMMTLVIECTEWLRHWSPGADKYYRAMFA